MAGAFVQSFVNSSGTTVTSLAVTLSGTTANNLLVATVSFQNNPATMAPLSGWTKREEEISASPGAGVTFDRIADGGETGVTFTWTTAREVAVVVCEYSGLDSTSPHEDSGENVSFISTEQTAGAPINTGSATPVSANGLAVAHHMGPDERDVNDSELSINNSYTKHVFTVSGTGNNPIASQASLVYTTTAAQSPDWDTSRTGNWRAYCAISVYKEPAAGTDIDATTDTLIITEQTAVVQADVDTNITSVLDTLVISEQAATIKLSVSISAGLDTLIITEQGATVQANVDTDISAGLDTLIIAEQTATVTLISGTVINANTDTLIITEQGAVVKLSQSIDAGFDTLVISEQTATVSLGTVVSAGVDTLIITENAAVVQANIDTNITAGLDTLLITENTAIVTTVVGIKIDGAATKILNANFQSTTLYFNDENYFTID